MPAVGWGGLQPAWATQSDMPTRICPPAHQPTCPPAHQPTCLLYSVLLHFFLLLCCSVKICPAVQRGARMPVWRAHRCTFDRQHRTTEGRKLPHSPPYICGRCNILGFFNARGEENSWSSNFMWFLKLIEMVANSKIVANHEHCWVECCLPNLSRSGRSSIDLIILRGNEIFEADKKGNCCMFPLNGRFNPGGEVVWWDDSTKGAVLSSKVAV